MTLQDLVEDYFNNDGDACIDCPHLQVTRQSSEFWGQKVWEELHECDALNRGKPEDCPMAERLLDLLKGDGYDNDSTDVSQD